jgi:hypothetical protein
MPTCHDAPVVDDHDHIKAARALLSARCESCAVRKTEILLAELFPEKVPESPPVSVPTVKRSARVAPRSRRSVERKPRKARRTPPIVKRTAPTAAAKPPVVATGGGGQRATR